MKQTEITLRKGSGPAKTVTGYAAGNFFVYKGHYYWRIAHLHTCTTLVADFARRKDAIAITEFLDGPQWGFTDIPPEEILRPLWEQWLAARGNCVNTNGILSAKEDVAHAAEEQASK